MKNLTAKDIMNSEVITVKDTMTVHELAAFFTDKMISGAPVVNKDNNLVGVVSLSDIVRNDAQRTAIIKADSETDFYLQSWDENFDKTELNNFHIEKDDDMLVHDIMTPMIFKVGENAAIADMADTMINGRIHRLIVTRNDQVLGIVTTLDMLKKIREY